MKDKHLVKHLNLSTVMSERFSRYTKSIIQQRALPDVRDGLKPVDRRILFAMNKSGNTYKHPYRKSAKAVGDVMGNLHPHGDSSIYEALIHMSQDWKMRAPLIDLHGNNGSMDGDPAAAMRYTEARTSKIAQYMVKDINKDTVDWVLNFDDTEYEPTVLPSRFPNLLVNGAMGIASGYATNIPPHNLGEVIDAVIYLQSHPNATLDDLMQFIKGPDFPTGGIIQGLNQLRKAYITGRGKIVVSSRAKIINIHGGRQAIKVTEIPYGVNKKKLVQQMSSIQFHHKVNGIAEIKDETSRSGLRIIIDLKRNADARGILNYLYKNTDLQTFYHFNDVAIDHMQPKRLSLKSMLVSYLNFQRRIIWKRTNYNLHQLRNRQEIVLGFIKAMNIITDVIKVIRHSTSHLNAQNNLVKRFNFTARQASKIVSLRLYRLTNTNTVVLHDENNLLNQKIKFCNGILHNHMELDAVLTHELLVIKHKYSTPRRTSIKAHVQTLHVSKQVTIPDEDVVVLVSHDGFLKRSSLHSFKASPLKQNGLKTNDFPLFIKHMNTRNHLFIFTNKGNLVYRPVVKITNARWKDTGQHISQVIGLSPRESFLKAIPFKTFKNTGSFLITTSDGYMKRVKFSDMRPGKNYRHHAFTYIKFHNPKANVVNVTYLPPDIKHMPVLLVSKNGYADKFDIAEIPELGRNARGVKAMNLKDGDSVQNAQLLADGDVIGLISKLGRFKLQSTQSIKLSHRNRRGVLITKFGKNSSDAIASFIKLNLMALNQPLYIYTNYRKLLSIVPSKFSIQRNTYAKGTGIMNTAQQGQPQLLLNS